MPADIREQIEAILTGKAPWYIMQRHGVDRFTDEQALETFSVGRPAILAFLAEHNIAIEDYGRFHGGITLFPRDAEWILRNEQYDEKFGPSPVETAYATREAAREALLDHILRYTHTGLDFTGAIPRVKYPRPSPPPKPPWKRWLGID